jgi:hypothetical protein
MEAYDRLVKLVEDIAEEVRIVRHRIVGLPR